MLLGHGILAHIIVDLAQVAETAGQTYLVAGRVPEFKRFLEQIDGDLIIPLVMRYQAEVVHTIGLGRPILISLSHQQGLLQIIMGRLIFAA